MNREFESFIKYEGKGVTAAATLGYTPQRVSQLKQGRSVGVKIAKIIVDKYPQINLYQLLYE